MRAEGDATTVEVETDFTITGKLARFGRGGMIQDVSNRLLRDFSDCLQKMIEGSGQTPESAAGPSPAAPPAPASAARSPAKPVGGFSLLFRALLDRIRRAFRRR
jgi:hypothetical protein